MRTLADRELGAGLHDLTWDIRDDGGRPLPSGLYFARLNAQRRTLIRRIVLLR